MPIPKKGESRSEYVGRAIHMLVHKEGLKQKQAVGKAEGMYSWYLAKRRRNNKHKG